MVIIAELKLKKESREKDREKGKALLQSMSVEIPVAETPFVKIPLAETNLRVFAIKGLIAGAIASVKESNQADLEQRIHFFKIVQEELKATSKTIPASISATTSASSSRSPVRKGQDHKSLDDGDDLTPEDLDLLKDDDLVHIQYGFEEEELLATRFYRQGSIDYIKMFYGDTGKIPPQFASDDWYAAVQAFDTSAETVLTEEAQAAFMKVQYSAAAGAQTDVNFKERNKLDTWIKFNPALFNLFQSMYAVTREVDYSRVG